MLEYRDYQIKCLQSVKEAYAKGTKRILVSMATGTGKTRVGVGIREFLGIKKKVLWLSQTEELIYQTQGEFHNQYPEEKCGIEMGNLFSSISDTIIIGSVQSLGKAGSTRIERFIPEEFGLIIVDECHHGITNNTTYAKIFKHFRVIEEEVNKKIDHPLLIGLTATPNRSDNVGLDLIYDEISFSYSIKDGIKDGWLSPLECKSITTDTDLDSVKSNTDFVNKELETVVNNTKRNELIFQSWKELCSDKQTLAFCVNIDHAETLNSLFKSRGVSCAVIHGDTPERREILNDYSSKNLKVLFNIKVLTEGYNDPDTSCIILARPTKSSLLFTQMIGRGTRLQRGIYNYKQADINLLYKKDCLILDVVDNTIKHKDSLMTVPKLFGLPSRVKVNKQNILKIQEEFEETKKNNPQVNFSDLNSISEINYFIRDINLFDVTVPKEIEQSSKFMWYKLNDDDYVLNLPNKVYITVHKNMLNKYELRATIDDILHETVNTLQEAFNYCEQWASFRIKKHELNFLKRDAVWHKNKPSIAQTKYLKFLLKGALPPNYQKYTKGDALKLINKLIFEKKKNTIKRA